MYIRHDKVPAVFLADEGVFAGEAVLVSTGRVITGDLLHNAVSAVSLE